jgi:hypothetical protein
MHGRHRRLVGERGTAVVERVGRAVDDRHDHGAIASHRSTTECGGHIFRLTAGGVI